MSEQAETAPEVQKARARQYALCTVALQHDAINAGAEGMFDQALTNGLAGIVAHMWPGWDVDRRGRVKSAADLLKVIVEKGTEAGDGIFHVADERDQKPEPEPEPEPVIDPFGGPSLIFRRSPHWMPNFITVRVGVLQAAIDATQKIRHARSTDADTNVTLSEEQINALADLSVHPALDGFWSTFRSGPQTTMRPQTKRRCAERSNIWTFSRREASWSGVL
jgi:hypothetical protein